MLFKKTIAALLFTFVTLPAFAESPVFKVSKDDSSVFIGGTIHLLSPQDYPLPDGFYQAFDESAKVFFEVDGSKLQDPNVQAQMASMMTLTNGQTLQTTLNEETYSALSVFITDRQLPIQAFSQFTPAGVSISLTIFELQRLGLGNPESGVDHFFETKANQNDAKSTGYLETVDEQIGFLGSLNEVDPNTLIKSSLEDLATLQASWKKGVAAWRRGDMSVMAKELGGDKMKAQFPSIHKTLLTDRNERWLSDIYTMFETPEIELILVGAMHLVGDDGLIELLRAQGYVVEQLK